MLPPQIETKRERFIYELWKIVFAIGGFSITFGLGLVKDIGYWGYVVSGLGVLCLILISIKCSQHHKMLKKRIDEYCSGQYDSEPRG